MNPLFDLLMNRRVVVCCGAGGVGKTTTSAALAIAAARAGRRVLVVTIDPSKRLAEALGVDRNPTDPVKVGQDTGLLENCKGELEAWMLDPQLIADNVVQRFSSSTVDASTLMANPIYRNVTAMVAGMQEYTAVQALYEFINEDRYDLVILDTPPSRDALRFLDAPERATAFLDKRIFNLFVPGDGGPIRRMATKLLEKVLDVSFGKKTRLELQQFFDLFGNLLWKLNQNQAEMRRFFRSEAVSFLLVTSPAQASLNEAQFFAQKTQDELSLNLAGVVLNRSMAHAKHWSMPETTDAALASSIGKLVPLAQREKEAMEAHLSLAKELAILSGEGWLKAMPNLGPEASTLDGLTLLAGCVAEPDGLTLSGHETS